MSKSKHPLVWLLRRKNGTLVARWRDPINPAVTRQESLSKYGINSKRAADIWLKRKSDDLRLRQERAGFDVGHHGDDMESFYAAYFATRVQEISAAAAERSEKRLKVHWMKFCEERGVSKVSQLTQELLYRFRLSMPELNPNSKNRYLNDLRAMLRWGIERGQVPLIEEDLKRHLKPFKARKSDVTTIPKEDLVKIINAALEHDQPDNPLSRRAPMAPMLFLLMLTGVRASEVVHLRWENINFERGVIKLRPHKGWDTKTRVGRDLLGLTYSPMLKTLLEFLRAQDPLSEFVLRGEAPDKPRTKQSRNWERLKLMAGVRCNPQLFRSTFESACAMAQNGPSPHHLAGVMGHGVAVAEKHYLVRGGIATPGESVEQWLEIEEELSAAYHELGYFG